MAYKLPRLIHLLVHAMLCADDPCGRNEGGPALNGLCRSLNEYQRKVRELAGRSIQSSEDLPISNLRLVRWRNIERLCAQFHELATLRMIWGVIKLLRTKLFHSNLREAGGCLLGRWKQKPKKSRR